MSDFPALTAVLSQDIPALAIDQWQNFAASHRASGAYAAALSFVTTFPYGGDPLAVAVANVAKHARWLEEGRDGFHLPAVIDWSGPHVKTSKKGVRYLSIPFGHRTPGKTGVSSVGARTMMSAHIVHLAKASLRGSRERRQAAVAALIAAGPQMSKVYDERLYQNASDRTKRVIAELRHRVQEAGGSPRPGHFGYTWASPKYAGLTHRTQRNAAGKATGGGWQTIRTLTENSTGWFIPPMQGFHFAQRTADAIRPHAVELITAAAREDFVDLIEAEIRALT